MAREKPTSTGMDRVLFEAKDGKKEIPAQDILDALSDGKSVSVVGVTIVGPLMLSCQTIKGELVLHECTMSDKFTASNAIFERQVELKGTRIKGGLLFFGTIFRCHVAMTEGTIESEANLTLARFDQGLDLTKSSFSANLIMAGVKADYVHMVDVVVKGSFDCLKLEAMKHLVATGLKCQGLKSVFTGLVVHGDVHLSGAVFKGPVEMSSMRLEGTILLQKAKFLAESTESAPVNSLFGSVVKGSLGLTEALFKGNTTFGSMKVGGHIGASGVKFEATVDMSRMNVRGQFNLTNAKLLGTHPKEKWYNSFEATIVEGGLLLTGALFKGKTTFQALVVQGDIYAAGITFKAQTIFNLMKLDGKLDLSKAQFLAPKAGGTQAASFFGCVIKGDMVLSEALFASLTTFESVDVHGNMLAKALHCKGPACFNYAKFNGVFDLSQSRFLASGKRGVLVNSFFGSVVKGGGLLLTETEFKGNTSFESLEVLGNISASGIKFEAATNMRRMKVGGQLNLTNAKLLGTGAKKAWHTQLESTVIKGDLVMHGALFEGTTTFKGLAVQGDVSADDVTFKSKVIFEGMKLGATIYLEGAQFLADSAGNAHVNSFFGCVIKGSLVLKKVRFKGNTTLESIVVEGNLVASEIKFEAAANMSFMSIGGELNLINAEFRCNGLKTQGNISFFGSTIARALLLTDAAFAREAVFDSVIVKGEFNARRITFTGPANFSHIKIGGKLSLNNAHFDKGVDFGEACFHAPFDLLGGRIKGKAGFAGAHFRDRAHFATVFGDPEREENDPEYEVMFNRAKFDGPVIFDATFLGGMWTFGARFNGFVKFRSNFRIKKLADWRETRFANIHFVDDLGELDKKEIPTGQFLQPFDGQVDWRGCRYAALQHDREIIFFWPVLRQKWRQQLGQRLQTVNRSKENEFYRFDPQPYEQLEKVCRRQGQDGLADEIYFEMRCRRQEYEKKEIRALWKGINSNPRGVGNAAERTVFYLGDIMERALFGWGVKPLQMFFWFICFWAIGTLIFWIHDSLYPAWVVSLCNLVPGLGEMKILEVGDTWQNPWAAFFTMVQHLLGWMLLAMLARRFFAGLSREGSDLEED